MSESVRRSSSGEAFTHRARRERIRERVVADGHVRIDDLAGEFEVSAMTIHRDLDELARQGWLRKVRGGASAEPSSSFHGDVRHRDRSMPGAKSALATAALDLVVPGQSIGLDDSTTALRMVELLPSRAPLTVVTNFLPTVNALAGVSGVDLIGLGGAYYPAYEAFLGMRTVESIKPLRLDALFLSTTAVVDGRCFHLSTETIQVKRALMDTAAQRVLLVDHSKFSKRALHELCPLTEFDLVLVDDGIGEHHVESLAEQGAHVRVVATSTGDVS